MFEKILIANRGEIACRVIKTAKKMGIKTVAVYSDPDSQALHVTMADEAVHIGPAASTESYLRADKIIEACKITGAQAVHPGYGFLSENADFQRQLENSNITFIGPNAEAIEVMGDKIASKILAEKAGVNTIPGYTDVIENADHAVKVANDIGYPVMLKASAGGGGKGMRVVYNDQECLDAFERSSNEARSSFGDDRIFAEKFIEEPRHIEIQIIADNSGNTVYLAERECSLQRRHQKVIEEAPSPFIDDKTRKAMGKQAVALAKAVQYQSAGTVEFIVDSARNFYFLEMNTRLQVEHPVTEMVVNQDLVELMLRVANMEKLPIKQSDVKINGWAVEARIYAEDPSRGFLPSIGRLKKYIPPKEDANVRVDTGIIEGSEVSMFYDLMIAKLTAHGSTREEAIDFLSAALDGYYIRGLSHNISFLNALIRHPRFREGRLTTNFISEEFPDGFDAGKGDGRKILAMIAIAALVHDEENERINNTAQHVESDEENASYSWIGLTSETRYQISVSWSENYYQISVNNSVFQILTDWQIGQPIFKAEINGELVTAQIEKKRSSYTIYHAGMEVSLQLLTETAAELANYMLEKTAADSGRYLLSPMPGLLVRLKVTEGDEVQSGDELAIVEAMKMENSLRAEQSGCVAKILANEGDSLDVDQPILEYELPE